jgi:hypothetical protein
MSTATATNPPLSTPVEDDALAYRAIHTGSILALLLGLVSAAVLTTAGSSLESTMMLAPIPLIGLVLSLRAWSFVRANSDRYTGANLALLGAVLSAVFLIGGVGYAGVVHATEVPEGYTRTSFLEMKPSEADLTAGRITSESVMDLLGKRVFIKGYIRPDSTPVTKNIKNFLLVRDNNQCCFGDLSKVQYFDQVQVALGKGVTTDASSKLFRVGGVLKIGPGNPELGTVVTFVLEADYIR